MKVELTGGVTGKDSLDRLQIGENVLSDFKTAGVHNVEQLMMRTQVELIPLLRSKQSIREFHKMLRDNQMRVGYRFDGVTRASVVIPEREKPTPKYDRYMPEYRELRDLATVLSALRATYASLFPPAQNSFAEPVNVESLNELTEYAESKLPDDLVNLLNFCDGEVGPSLAHPSVLPYEYILMSSDHIANTMNRFRKPWLAEVWEKEIQKGAHSGMTIDTFWAPGWFPFATTESKILAIDMNPGQSGRTGQIIICGCQGTPTKWLCNSLAEFFGQIEYGLRHQFFFVNEDWEMLQGYGREW